MTFKIEIKFHPKSLLHTYIDNTYQFIVIHCFTDIEKCDMQLWDPIVDSPYL